jgi:hypothetical protein
MRRRSSGLLRVARNDVERLVETQEFVIARSSCDDAIQLLLFCLLRKKQGVGLIFPIDQFDQSGLGALAGFV